MIVCFSVLTPLPPSSHIHHAHIIKTDFKKFPPTSCSMQMSRRSSFKSLKTVFRASSLKNKRSIHAGGAGPSQPQPNARPSSAAGAADAEASGHTRRQEAGDGMLPGFSDEKVEIEKMHALVRSPPFLISPSGVPRLTRFCLFCTIVLDPPDCRKACIFVKERVYASLTRD